eukprot:GHVU01038926.1.p1 GENE.GHVU01038926.1~~GHVU01038926.1.p1  ORF type:complete len:120 (-),score=5.86 GHVU01038926.1:352-711(-)
MQPSRFIHSQPMSFARPLVPSIINCTHPPAMPRTHARTHTHTHTQKIHTHTTHTHTHTYHTHIPHTHYPTHSLTHPHTSCRQACSCTAQVQLLMHACMGKPALVSRLRECAVAAAGKGL